VYVLPLAIATTMSVASSAAVERTISTLDDHKVDIAEIIRASDEIVEAEIIGVRDLALSAASSSSKPSRLLEVRVRAVLWGDALPAVRFVIAGADTLNFRGFAGPAPGDVDVLCIERWHEIAGHDDSARQRLKDAAATSDVMQIVAAGRGRFPSREEHGRRVVWAPTYSIALWSPLPAAIDDPEHHLDGWSCIDRSEFVGCLTDSVKRFVPSIDAHIEVHDRCDPSVSINPGGRCQNLAVGSGGTSDIGTDGLAHILDVAQVERFFDLPASIGRAAGRDSSGVSIRIRTEHGARLVRIHGPVMKSQDNASESEAFARAVRVLRAIPYAKDWHIDGA
jgi:hypothetical protein